MTSSSVRYCFPAKWGFFMLGNKKYMVPNQKNMEGNQPVQSHGHAQQPHATTAFCVLNYTYPVWLYLEGNNAVSIMPSFIAVAQLLLGLLIWHHIFFVPQHEETPLGWEAVSDRWWGHVWSRGLFPRIRMRASIPRESKPCNTDGRSLWTPGETMLKNKHIWSKSTIASSISIFQFQFIFIFLGWNYKWNNTGITKYTYEYNRKFGLYIIQTLTINISGHNIRRYTYKKTRDIWWNLHKIL